jgi:hypothetical protein
VDDNRVLSKRGQRKVRGGDKLLLDTFALLSKWKLGKKAFDVIALQKHGSHRSR